MNVNRTVITIGDGTSIGEFAKQAVASALEPDEPEPRIKRTKWIVHPTPEVRELQRKARPRQLFLRLE